MSASSNDTVVLKGELTDQQPTLPRELSTNTVVDMGAEDEDDTAYSVQDQLNRRDTTSQDSVDTVVRLRMEEDEVDDPVLVMDDPEEESSADTVVRMETSRLGGNSGGGAKIKRAQREPDPSISLPAPVVPGRPADLRAQLHASRKASLEKYEASPKADTTKSDSKRDSEILAMEGEELLFVGAKTKTRGPSALDDLEASVLAMKEEDLLFVASRVGDLELVEAVVEAGCDVDTRDDVARRTPLMVAAENGHAALCSLLCGLGADVNARDQGFSAQTALTRAIIHGHANVVRKLIEWDASVDLPDATSKTPLMYSVLTGRVDLCLALLELGCESVNSKDVNQGYTALMLAAQSGNLLMCKALCDPRKPPFEHEIRKVGFSRKVAQLIVAYAITDTRADWNIKSKAGKTARGLALAGGHKDIARYFSAAQNRKEIMEREKWGGSPRGGGAKIQRGFKAFKPRAPQNYRTPVARYR